LRTQIRKKGKEVNKFALVNCDVYTGDSVLTEHRLVVREGKIAEIRPFADGEVPDAPDVDLGGQSVSPGFIDLQVNGGGDVLFNDDPTPEGLDAILRGHRKLGTTDLLPTYITGPLDGMRRAFDAVRAAHTTKPGILGIHFEGPILNENKLGVHDARFVRAGASDELSDIYRPGGVPMMVTLAPERADRGFIKSLVDRGIRVAAGHTNATADEIDAAIGEGLSCGTHVWNAMSPLTSRESGAVGALMADKRVWCDFVADGFHVAFTTLGLSLRAVAPRHAFLVTDAMSPVGGSKGGYTLGSYDVTVRDGKCVTEDGTLAGSALDLATAMRNIIQKLGVPKDEALRMGTLYPAEFLGVSDRRGRIAIGYPAHLAIFDNEIHVSAVVYDGKYDAVGSL
jgi:N-acetylglucosamine-6-phosphate deacetylase